MQPRRYSNEFRTTVVCVDSYEKSVLCGRFYNPFLKYGNFFDSLTDFLLKMEQMLDTMNLPQSFTAPRVFAQPPPVNFPCTYPSGPQEGKLATFSVRIIFRQNVSWQGSVTWLESEREETFHSVLELILLMNSALSSLADGAETKEAL